MLTSLCHRRRSLFLPVTVLLLSSLGLSGCDEEASRTAHAPSRPEPPPVARPFAGEAMVDQTIGGQAKEAGAVAGDEADARIEERRAYTLQFDDAERLVAAYRETHEACVASEHCQVEQGRLETPRHGLASGYLALRVARDMVESAESVRRVADSPALSGVEITRQDRTRQMIDIEARLEQQRVLRDRLAELAREGRGAGDQRIQDLLQVERELARVQGEIESLQGQQRYLARVTDSVAVSASFQEQRGVEPYQHGVLAPLWRALDRSTTLFFESVGQVILVVVFLTPWLVIGIPALWLLSRLWRPLRRAFSRLGGKRRAYRKAKGE